MEVCRDGQYALDGNAHLGCGNAGLSRGLKIAVIRCAQINKFSIRYIVQTCEVYDEGRFTANPRRASLAGSSPHIDGL